ncbi:MAG: hypothetical protein JWN32_2932 [Solirubrobacterales bacterium]|nr:hypothetical protein [Solirubrobacterales bacterium]
MVTPRVTELPPTERHRNRYEWATSSQRQLVIASLLATKSESGKPGKPQG